MRVSAGLGGVRVTDVRASGVRLRGRLAGGKVSWGAVDKLLPAPTGAPFTLPDLDVALNDARIALATPYGAVGARLDGTGNLSDGFRGKLAAMMPAFRAGDCIAGRATAYVDLAIRERRPTLTGPVRADAATCGVVRIVQPSLVVDVALSEALDSWRGTTRLAAAAVAAGSKRLAEPSGRIAFSGNSVATNGTVQLASPAASAGSTRLGGLTLDGKFGARAGGGDAQGRLRVARLVPDRRYAAQALSTARSTVGTPVGPLVERIALAMRNTGQAVAAEADFAALTRPSGASAIVTRLTMTAPDGVVLTVAGGEGIRFGALGLLADSQITLSGGGFPEIAASFPAHRQRRNARVRQDCALCGAQRPAGADARALAGTRGKWRIQTEATLDGPLGDGRVAGLRVPLVMAIDARGRLAVNPACAPVGFRMLEVSGLRLAPATMRVCPIDGALVRAAGGVVRGGAVVDAPRLTGRLGGTPLTLAASRAQVALANSGFAVSNLSARLGTADRITAIDIGALQGRAAGEGLAGGFGKLSGKIGGVPLLMDDAAGQWTFARGVLQATGEARVADEAAPVRFNPVRAGDIRFRLADGQIAVTGMLREPKTLSAVAAVTIAHNLARGTGNAKLDVADLRFGKTLQPEMLTPLTLGVVANVEGRITGRATLRGRPLVSRAPGASAHRGSTLPPHSVRLPG